MELQKGDVVTLTGKANREYRVLLVHDDGWLWLKARNGRTLEVSGAQVKTLVYKAKRDLMAALHDSLLSSSNVGTA